MVETDLDNKQKRQATWLQEVELNDDQLEKLIEEKIIRARVFYNAWQKREVLLEDR